MNGALVVWVYTQSYAVFSSLRGDVVDNAHQLLANTAVLKIGHDFDPESDAAVFKPSLPHVIYHVRAFPGLVKRAVMHGVI